MNLLGDDELPIGFGMALAKDTNAMNAFSAMTKAEQEKIIMNAKQMNSKNQMESYVSGLSRESFR